MRGDTFLKDILGGRIKEIKKEAKWKTILDWMMRRDNGCIIRT